MLLLLLLSVGLGCTRTPAASVAADTRTVHGVLLDVQSTSLQKVDKFTLRTDDGDELSFMPSPDFNQGVEHQMTPGHMRQHMALGEPVTITYREENGTLVALTATD